MDALPYVDTLFKEYLHFRGFTDTFQAFNKELADDRSCGFQADQITDLIFGKLIPDLNCKDLVEFLYFINDRFYIHLGSQYQPTIRKLETSIYKCLLITAVRAQRQDKVHEFFKLYGDMLLEGSDGPMWRSWAALIWLKKPAKDPWFQVYFSPDWQNLLEVGFRNFMCEVLSCLPLPAVLMFNVDRHRRLALEEQVDSLQRELANLRHIYSERQAKEQLGHRPPFPLRTTFLGSVANHVPSLSNASQHAAQAGSGSLDGTGPTLGSSVAPDGFSAIRNLNAHQDGSHSLDGTQLQKGSSAESAHNGMISNFNEVKWREDRALDLVLEASGVCGANGSRGRQKPGHVRGYEHTSPSESSLERAMSAGSGARLRKSSSAADNLTLPYAPGGMDVIGGRNSLVIKYPEEQAEVIEFKSVSTMTDDLHLPERTRWNETLLTHNVNGGADRNVTESMSLSESSLETAEGQRRDVGREVGSSGATSTMPSLSCWHLNIQDRGGEPVNLAAVDFRGSLRECGSTGHCPVQVTVCSKCSRLVPGITPASTPAIHPMAIDQDKKDDSSYRSLGFSSLSSKSVARVVSSGASAMDPVAFSPDRGDVLSQNNEGLVHAGSEPVASFGPRTHTCTQNPISIRSDQGSYALPQSYNACTGTDILSYPAVNPLSLADECCDDKPPEELVSFEDASETSLSVPAHFLTSPQAVEIPVVVNPSYHLGSQPDSHLHIQSPSGSIPQETPLASSTNFSGLPPMTTSRSACVNRKAAETSSYRVDVKGHERHLSFDHWSRTLPSANVLDSTDPSTRTRTSKDGKGTQESLAGSWVPDVFGQISGDESVSLPVNLPGSQGNMLGEESSVNSATSAASGSAFWADLSLGRSNLDVDASIRANLALPFGQQSLHQSFGRHQAARPRRFSHEAVTSLETYMQEEIGGAKLWTSEE